MVRVTSWLVVLFALVLLLGVAAPALGVEVEGKIKEVVKDSDKVVLTDREGKEWTFHFDDNTKALLNDRQAKVADFNAGDEIKVTFDEEDDTFLARNSAARGNDSP